MEANSIDPGTFTIRAKTGLDASRHPWFRWREGLNPTKDAPYQNITVMGMFINQYLSGLAWIYPPWFYPSGFILINLRLIYQSIQCLFFFAHPNEIQLDLASLISSNWKHITLMYKVEKRMHLKNLRYLEWYLGDCADHPAWTMAKECFLHRGLGYDEDREADCGWLWPSSCCAWLCSNDFILNISGPVFKWFHIKYIRTLQDQGRDHVAIFNWDLNH